MPGGHVEPGETPTEAAVRELHEETGWPLAESALTVIGWNRLDIQGPKPDGFHYPHPTGYLTYFTARLTDPGRPTTLPPTPSAPPPPGSPPPKSAPTARPAAGSRS